MADFINKIKKSLEDSFDLAKNNAQNFKDFAEEYGKSARLKFELVQLKSSKKKKMNLLGQTVFPFLLEHNYDGLKNHETLLVLIDDIKLLQNEIDLTERELGQISTETEQRPEFDRQQVRDQIEELESQIEERIRDLKSMKESLEKEEK